MMSAQRKEFKLQNQEDVTLQTFLDDMTGIFSGLSCGEAGKYMYENVTDEKHPNLWEDIVNLDTDYYIPKADKALMQQAQNFLISALPQGIPYVDFGAGSISSFNRYAQPTMALLGSKKYIGIDFDYGILDQIQSISPVSPDISINTVHLDFFNLNEQVPPIQPSLGVMNGVTLTNMYGSLHEQDLSGNLSRTLKHLHALAGNGYLLLSIDTNQDEASLLKMYLTPLNSQLNIASLSRMESQLPVDGFDSSLFSYSPEWISEQQLLAHIAVATEHQSFLLGDRRFQVNKGQKIHLFNSYKFRQSFFEDVCDKANLKIVKHWKHETGVALYLLKGIL